MPSSNKLNQSQTNKKRDVEVSTQQLNIYEPLSFEAESLMASDIP